MIKIDLEIHDDVVSVVTKISNINDDGIDLEVPEGSVLFDNIISLKLIKQKAEEMGKTIHFITTDEQGLNLLAYLEDEEGFMETFTGGLGEETSLQGPGVSHTVKSKLSGLSLPAVSLSGLRIPNFGKLSGTKFLIPLVIFALLVGGGIYYATKAPKAEVNIIANTEPLTKSLAVKIKADTDTNTQEKIIKGMNLEASTTHSASIETTGEKLVGEKAEGKIKIYNKTDSDKKLKKGTKLEYKDLVYVLTDDETVPARTDDLLDPTKITPGEKTTDIEAADIGEDYNIDKDKNMEFDDYKTTELVAVTEDKISGGSSKTVKVVSEEDITNLKTKATKEALDAAEKALREKLGKGQTLVTGSASNKVASEEFNAKEGDETDTLEISQSVTGKGLAYVDTDLEKAVFEISKEYIPEGFKVSDKDKNVRTSVLGNTSTSVLNSGEADLQVTFKVLLVPDIDEGKLKEDMAGKSLQDAQKILSGVKNIETYELKITPNIPFMKKMPAKENINLTVEINDD